MHRGYDPILEKLKPEYIDEIRELMKDPITEKYWINKLTKKCQEDYNLLNENKIVLSEGNNYYKCRICNRNFQKYKQHIKSNKHIESMDMNKKMEEQNKKNNDEEKERKKFCEEAEKENKIRINM